MKASPLSAMTGHALDDAQGSGNADLRLKLELPISDMHKSRVQGALTLAGNDLRITPDTPALARTRGTVQFSETGFALAGVQARALGAMCAWKAACARPRRPCGAGGAPAAIARPGHRQCRRAAPGTRARRTGPTGPEGHGNHLQPGVCRAQGVPELQVSTSLQGMALALPAPLGKAAESALPVRFENQVTRASLAPAPNGAAVPLQDRLVLRVEGVGAVDYLRDWVGGTSQVVNGSVTLGLGSQEEPPRRSAAWPPTSSWAMWMWMPGRHCWRAPRRRAERTPPARCRTICPTCWPCVPAR
jgi:hypothetical protein